MPIQLHFYFSDYHKRICECGQCSTCTQRKKRERHRLRKFLGEKSPRRTRQELAYQRAKEQAAEDELERKLNEKFKRMGWD